MKHSQCAPVPWVQGLLSFLTPHAQFWKWTSQLVHHGVWQVAAWRMSPDRIRA